MKKIIIALSICSIFCGDNTNVKAKNNKASISKSDSYAKGYKKKQLKRTIQDSFTEAAQAILIDFDTGETLYELNSNTVCTPSSMTKLMTLYILFEAIKFGRITLDDEWLVSEQAQRMEGSRSFFKAGTTAKVEDLIRSIIVHSGNDACIIAAEGLYGDESLFTEEMNRKKEIFGLKNTHFTNSTGLPDNQHYSTVSDIAVIARRIIQDFPEYYHYFAEKTFTVNGITQQNRNTLLGNSMGVDGLKTGHTNAGGYGLVASTNINNKRMIAVVNGCKSMKSRAFSANKLLAFGYKAFIRLRPIIAWKPISSIKVWLGNKPEVDVCLEENLTISIPKKYQDSIKVEAKMVEPIEAPIKAGTKVGTLIYRYEGFQSKPYDLLAIEDIDKAPVFQRIKSTINYLIFGNSERNTHSGSHAHGTK